MGVGNGHVRWNLRLFTGQESHTPHCLSLAFCALDALKQVDSQHWIFRKEIAPFPLLDMKERRAMKQKLKTHKAMAKRVKITGSGKFMRRKVALNHLRRNKSPEAIRSMDKYFELSTSDKRRMKHLLPYAF
jgi:large subunit ribosomal protein L35